MILTWTSNKLKLDITGNFLEREVLLRFIEMDKNYKVDNKVLRESCSKEAKDKFSDLESTVLKEKNTTRS